MANEEESASTRAPETVTITVVKCKNLVSFFIFFVISSLARAQVIFFFVVQLLCIKKLHAYMMHHVSAIMGVTWTDKITNVHQWQILKKGWDGQDMFIEWEPIGYQDSCCSPSFAKDQEIEVDKN